MAVVLDARDLDHLAVHDVGLEVLREAHIARQVPTRETEELADWPLLVADVAVLLLLVALLLRGLCQPAHVVVQGNVGRGIL